MSENDRDLWIPLAANAVLHVVQLDDDTAACRIETPVQQTDWKIKQFGRKAQQAKRCNP